MKRLVVQADPQGPEEPRDDAAHDDGREPEVQTLFAAERFFGHFASLDDCRR
jgi:hypothetical protein